MFLGVKAAPGAIARRRVQVGEYADGSPITLPVAVVRGRADGPTVYIQSGLHGDELTGIEVCRRALAELDPAQLTGSVVAVPVANVPAHVSRSRGFIHEERSPIDMNRIFPGRAEGLLSERIASVLFDEFLMQADLTLDLHSALDGCDIALFSNVDPDDDDDGTLALRERAALAFGAPYVYYKKRGERLGTSDMTNSIRGQAEARGRPAISAEMGESRRVSEHLVSPAVRGVHNVLRVMGVESGDPEIPTPPRIFRKIDLVHASRGGGLRMHVQVGDDVQAGQVIGEIVDVFGETVERIESTSTGFVLRRMMLGSVSTGAEVAWIGS